MSCWVIEKGEASGRITMAVTRPAQENTGKTEIPGFVRTTVKPDARKKAPKIAAIYPDYNQHNGAPGTQLYAFSQYHESDQGSK